MQVTYEKRDDVNGVLHVTISPEDYKNEVKKELTAIGIKHPLKGFRPGHVPAALLQKMYGEHVTQQVVDRQVGRALVDHINEQHLSILGEPMIAEDSAAVDIMSGEPLEFKFDVGLAPNIDLKLNKRMQIPYYLIEVTDEMLEQQHAALRKRYGKQVPGEVAADDSLLRGSLVELDEAGQPKADGIKVERTVISPQYIKDEEQHNLLVGAKKGDVLRFNPHKACNGNIAELSSMLNLDRDNADVKSDFNFTIEEILVNEDAEVNQEFFDQVLGKDQAHDEQEYREKLRTIIAGQYRNDSNFRFTIDAERVLTKAAGELALPEEFLKRYLKLRRADQDKPIDDADFEKHFPDTLKQLRWQLIKEYIAKENDLKVSEEDMLNLAKLYIAQQFAQYGLGNLPEDVMEQQAQKYLAEDRFNREIAQRAMDDKVFSFIKSNVKVNEKTVSMDEFNKLFEPETEQPKQD